MSVTYHAGTTKQAEICAMEVVQFLLKFGLLSELRKGGQVLVKVGDRDLVRVSHSRDEARGTFNIELLDLAQQVKQELGATRFETAGSA